MTIASIVILGSISLADAGDAGPPVATVEFAIRPPARWERADFERPGRRNPSSILYEEEDEDDTGDDAPVTSGHGHDVAIPSIDDGGRCRGRHPVRVASRSASPTLRLRC